MKRPENICKGDKVAIISPAAPVNPEYVKGACHRLKYDYGLIPVVMPHTLAETDGIFASTLENRLHDFKEAWTDPQIKAVICSRGGYGSVQLLPELIRFFNDNPELPPKWLVGFSDITVFHSLFSMLGLESIHGPMTKNIATTPNESVKVLFDILLHDYKPSYTSATHPYNIGGCREGVLTGGNFATFNGLAATPFDPVGPEGLNNKILFIEDVGENIYEINRMLYRLGLAGSLGRLAGIVVGQFTAYKSDKNFQTMEEMIHHTLSQFELNGPVIFNFSAGHIDNNLPLIMGSWAEIRVDKEESQLKFI